MNATSSFMASRNQKLMPEARDSHWVMAYGDYFQELSYAARKIGVRWVDLTQPLN